eukprot:gb/GECG01010036.1/.p1 GENE.gb/GECG01010036.1/~~gb/GECG01010036.1/.p1  ORF type:complete len:786 (+),score=125.32 gb/GECG01010036.1/:1-2358(+)
MHKQRMNPIKEAIQQHNKAAGEGHEEEEDDDDINTIYYYILVPHQDLRSLQDECFQYIDRVLSDYMWQEEAFTLYRQGEGPPIPAYRRPPTSSNWSMLHGKTRFGDNIEDEWLVVSLLFRISETHRDVVVFMEDDDGEFLAIEAAEEIPEWLHPENTTNHLAVHQGSVHIVPPSQEAGADGAVLGITKACDAIRDTRVPTKASAGVQQAIQNRVTTDISQAARRERHVSLCTVPRLVAELLAHRPQLVAPAVNAFYTRDAIDIKACTKMHSFPLDSDPHHFVSLPVRFTKCTYAQLRQQRMHIPKVWQRYIPTEEEQQGTGRWLNGMKLTCGLEILLSRGAGYHLLHASKYFRNVLGQGDSNMSDSILSYHRKRFANAIVRQSGDGLGASQSKQQATEHCNASFDMIVRQNVSSRAINTDCLKNDKSSAEELYSRLLKCSKIPNTRWLRIVQRYDIDYTLLIYDLLCPRIEYGILGKECPQLLWRETHFADLSGGEEDVEDEDQWLREGAEKLERVLEQRAQEIENLSGSPQPACDAGRGEPDTDGVATAQSVIEEMNSFVNRMSDYEGVENDHQKLHQSQPVDEEVDNDDAQYAQANEADGNQHQHELAELRKQLQGIYSQVDVSRLRQGRANDDAQWLKQCCRSDATIRYSRRRNLEEDPSATNSMDYMYETMDAELASSTIKDSFSTVNNGSFTQDSNVNYNLVKNMAHSVGNQSGLAGPASNVLKEMGVEPPPDWLAGQVSEEKEEEYSNNDDVSDEDDADQLEGDEDLPASLKEKLEVLD